MSAMLMKQRACYHESKGSPVNAGMSLMLSKSLSISRKLPRRCGDVPSEKLRRSAFVTVRRKWGGVPMDQLDPGSQNAVPREYEAGPGTMQRKIVIDRGPRRSDDFPYPAP